MKEKEGAAISDMTGTLVSPKFFFGCVEALFRKGLLDFGGYMSIDTYYKDLYQSGRMPYKRMTTSCVTSFFQGLEGKRREDVISEVEKFVAGKGKDYLYKTSEKIFEMLDSCYERTIALTGFPEELMRGLCMMLPFKTYFASSCELVEGRYGAHSSDIGAGEMWKIRMLGSGEEKLAAIEGYEMSVPINWSRSFAAGNTEEDFPFLKKVPYPLLFNVRSRPKVRRRAAELGMDYRTVDTDHGIRRNINVVRKNLEKIGVLASSSSGA